MHREKRGNGTRISGEGVRPGTSANGGIEQNMGLEPERGRVDDSPV